MHMNISACAAWAPGLGDLTAWRSWPPDDGSAPEIRFVNALLRRRLGRLSRMALHVANEAATGWASLSTIFASRHGELSRTVGILHALAANEAPSPTAFSLSVHNSAAGIFSIFRADRAPSTALAAGEETLLWALAEAAIRLASDPDTAILLVYADEPLPGEYGSSAIPGDLAHAVAFLLAPGEGLSLEWVASSGLRPSQEPLSMAILANFLGHRERIEWHGERLSVHGFCHA
ncbi:MAG: beta-ketoacyl synthase chain length factor [Pseudomonadota bacterium]|nr:beta-ketoacyl synthase chain length factor [Pseudomonadota bacterium]